MSELRVDNIVDMGGSGAPQLRKGASVTGISTITQAVVGNATINAGGINATGIVTSSSNKFVGDFASGNITAGVMTATSSVVASNITINSGGVNASGIVSATSYQGSGANLTGIGLSIAPLMYTPDVSDSSVDLTAGIGLTFNQRVSAGTGNVTLSLVAVGSTLVENFGVGSSVTYNNDADPPNITINPTADLSVNTVYAISYPSGAFTQSGAGGSFVGTAYTFATRNLVDQMWMVGANTKGQLGQNSSGNYFSSPVQVPGQWSKFSMGAFHTLATKTDGTLWAWGDNGAGRLGLNETHPTGHKSSPVQVGSDTTWNGTLSASYTTSFAIKTDGTLWGWGNNDSGEQGQNNRTPVNYSSPTQIGSGTDWLSVTAKSSSSVFAVKTNGTLWAWGNNAHGKLAQNNHVKYSSPTQIPGTTWTSKISSGHSHFHAIKTDGTLWAVGEADYGQLGDNTNASKSSPVQIGSETTWSSIDTSKQNSYAKKTDGTFWVWGGNNDAGGLGLNNTTKYSSPVQLPGTTWKAGKGAGTENVAVVKTDGTLWTWGEGYLGSLAHNSQTDYSSPVQVPGTTWSKAYGNYTGGNGRTFILTKQV